MKVLHFDPIVSGKDKRITLDKGEGILIEEKSNKVDKIYYFKSEKDLAKHTFSDSECNYKFIGFNNVFTPLMETFNNQGKKFTKFQIIEDAIEVFCYLEEGRIRVKKDTFKDNRDEKYRAQKKKVLIIDDSPTMRKILNKIISSSNEFEVMDMADRPSKAKEILEDQTPDIITLDIHMPEMNGIEFLKSYLKFKKIPTILITSVTKKEGPLVMEGLENGASSYIQKPTLEELTSDNSTILNELKTYTNSGQIQETVIRKSFLRFTDQKGLIAIGSSTGGTQALKTLFSQLPDSIPPIVVVQHIPESFSGALAESLDKHFKFKIKEAVNAEKLEPNTIYIANGGKHLKLLEQSSQLVCRFSDDPPVGQFKPSVEYMFESLSKLELDNLVTVMLTGMGSDGARSMTELSKKGHPSIVQNEESCVVFGMPKAVIDLGGANHIVHLNEMGEKVVNCYNNNSKKAKNSAA